MVERGTTQCSQRVQKKDIYEATQEVITEVLSLQGALLESGHHVGKTFTLPEPGHIGTGVKLLSLHDVVESLGAFKVRDTVGGKEPNSPGSHEYQRTRKEFMFLTVLFVLECNELMASNIEMSVVRSRQTSEMNNSHKQTTVSIDSFQST
jgi:hypothetical protein